MRAFVLIVLVALASQAHAQVTMPGTLEPSNLGNTLLTQAAPYVVGGLGLKISIGAFLMFAALAIGLLGRRRSIDRHNRMAFARGVRGPGGRGYRHVQRPDGSSYTLNG